MEESFLFIPCLTKTDVTAVRLLPAHILAGVGGYLNIFDKQSEKLISKLNIFSENKIHGILPDSNCHQLLIYGGKEIQIITLNEGFLSIRSIVSKKTLQDWILTAKWIDGDTKVATVSMHNILSIWSQKFELELEVQCEEKCLLYSAFICYDTGNNIVVLSGTVFSEVLVWTPRNCGENNCAVVLKRLKKHNGVIFSIDYSEQLGFICSTSDDRSAVLWSVRNKSLSTELQQEQIEIADVCQVYGHQARIFRCKILNHLFVTAGEDSLLNVWDFNGNLQRKIELNGGTIWCLDYTDDVSVIIAGKADSGVAALKVKCPVSEKKIMLRIDEKPKHVGILNSGNLVVITDHAVLYRFKKSSQKLEKIKHHTDLQSYVLLKVSTCRKMVALAGIKGQIYIYKEDSHGLLLKYFHVLAEQPRIFSFHWLDCRTFLVCQNRGKLHLCYLDNDINLADTFILPPSRERWSTCACKTLLGYLVVGDRMGNIHHFHLNKTEPLMTIRKAHDHLGVSNLQAVGGYVKSLGRNGVIKNYESLMGLMGCTSTEKTQFSWLADIVDHKYLLAFSGDNFLVCDYLSKRIVFEKVCGGGHRSWDFFHQHDVTTNLVFVKDKAIHLVEFRLQDFETTDYLAGYHVKNINAIKVLKYGSEYIVISGGEDTTLKVNIMENSKLRFSNSLKSHLSSIRALTTYKLPDEFYGYFDDHLVFSAGGRAQVICWRVSAFRDDMLTAKLTEVHSYYEEIDKQDSEMRIMCLSVSVYDKQIFLFCGCSDGNIKTFYVERNMSGYKLIPYKTIFYQLNCIMKLCTFYLNKLFLLVTMATDGKIVFWDISDFTNNDDNFEPINSFQTHQSGINSYSFKIVDKERFLLLTGGDDNAVKLSLFQYKQNENAIHIVRIDTFSDVVTHCAQVTGAFLHEKYFFTSSVDQRLAVFKYECVNDIVRCEFMKLYKTTVEDLQGLECIVCQDGSFEIFIYGNGLEYLQVSKSTND